MAITDQATIQLKILIMPARTLISALILVALAVLPVYGADKAPLEVGGFKLGTDIEQYPDLIDTNYLKETVVTDRHGFRKGVISYGICKYTNTILKIQLKYEDSSKEYFKTLLNKFKKEYGAPDEWKGDSFGILHVWKWYFTDEKGRKVTLLLQHNLRDPNENIGNVVKLNFPELLKEERECFNEMCEQLSSEGDKKRMEQLKKPDWRYLIPR